MNHGALLLLALLAGCRTDGPAPAPAPPDAQTGAPDAPPSATDARPSATDARPDTRPGTPDTRGPATASGLALTGARIAGGPVADVEVRDGRIVAVGQAGEVATTVDASGKWLAPAFIDSHVHLAYYPVAEQLASGGVAAAVDLAAPVESLAKPAGSVRILRSGPMVTAIGGYPTRSWGRNGYGIECADGDAAVAAVERLHGLGAALIKLPLAGPPMLEEPALRAAVARAHALSLKVTSHALGDEEAALAAAVGVDLLAHTPTGPLLEATVTAWADRTVISTLRAFGGGAAAVANLRSLRAAGARVLYGTDLGNTRTAAIDGEEIRLLGEAGLDGAAILAAGTSTPAAYWGLDDLGVIEVGRRASILVLEADPLTDPRTLARPVAVYIDGEKRFGD